MKELKLKSMVLSVSEKDPMAFNGKITDNKLSVRFATPMSRNDREGIIKDSFYINIEKESLINAIRIISDDVKTAYATSTQSACIRVLDIVLNGVDLPVIQYVLGSGEESPIQKIRVEHNTVITIVDMSSIRDIQLMPISEELKKTIKEIIDDGKEERRKLEEEKIANRKLINEQLAKEIATQLSPIVENITSPTSTPAQDTTETN